MGQFLSVVGSVQANCYLLFSHSHSRIAFSHEIHGAASTEALSEFEFCSLQAVAIGVPLAAGLGIGLTIQEDVKGW